MQNQQQHTPILLFLLNYNKIPQLIKSLFSQQVSNNLLRECGFDVLSGMQESAQRMSKQEYKKKQSAKRFNVRQLIYIKGSNYQKIKEYENIPFMNVIKKKLQTQIIQDMQTRKLLWVQFTGLFHSLHFYDQIKQLELPTQFLVGIQKDIARTYKSPEVKQKTQEVLQTFSKYNPYIGYCQGMHTIIAFLISQNFTQQQSFFIFKHVTEQKLPCEYYSNMDCIMTYMRIFYEMLNFTHPKTYAHLKKLSKQMDNSYIVMVSYVLQWFVCLFCQDDVSDQITKVVWDFFMIDGVIVLFKAALAMFDFLEPHILKCKNFEQYNEMQKTTIKNINDAKSVRNRIINTYISQKMLMIIKQKLMEKDDKHNKEAKTTKKKQGKQKKCNRRWTVCIPSLEKHLQAYSSFDFFVFKPKNVINIIPDYMEKMNNIYFNSEKMNSPAYQLKIGRSEHVCHAEQEVFTDDSSSQKNTQGSRERRKKYVQSLSDPKSPIRINQQMIRKKAALKVQQVMKKKSGMRRSQSIIFMQDMMRNVSLSNLLELYEIDQIFQQ